MRPSSPSGSPLPVEPRPRLAGVGRLPDPAARAAAVEAPRLRAGAGTRPRTASFGFAGSIAMSVKPVSASMVFIGVPRLPAVGRLVDARAPGSGRTGGRPPRRRRCSSPCGSMTIRAIVWVSFRPTLRERLARRRWTCRCRRRTRSSGGCSPRPCRPTRCSGSAGPRRARRSSRPGRCRRSASRSCRCSSSSRRRRSRTRRR